MSDLPANIDAILASIRARMTEESPAAEPLAPPPFPALPAIDPAPQAEPAPDFAAVRLEGGGMTLDALLRSTLEPLLKAWLDAHAPEIVERLAQAEIRRLTGTA